MQRRGPIPSRFELLLADWADASSDERQRIFYEVKSPRLTGVYFQSLPALLRPPASDRERRRLELALPYHHTHIRSLFLGELVVAQASAEELRHIRSINDTGRATIRIIRGEIPKLCSDFTVFERVSKAKPAIVFAEAMGTVATYTELDTVNAYSDEAGRLGALALSVEESRAVLLDYELKALQAAGQHIGAAL